MLRISDLCVCLDSICDDIYLRVLITMPSSHDTRFTTGASTTENFVMSMAVEVRLTPGAIYGNGDTVPLAQINTWCGPARVMRVEGEQVCYRMIH